MAVLKASGEDYLCSIRVGWACTKIEMEQPELD